MTAKRAEEPTITVNEVAPAQTEIVSEAPPGNPMPQSAPKPQGGIASVDSLLTDVRRDSSKVEAENRQREQAFRQRAGQQSALLGSTPGFVAPTPPPVPTTGGTSAVPPTDGNYVVANSADTIEKFGNLTLEQAPAEFKTVTETVVTQEASTELVTIPATYETVMENDGSLPLLMPMSQIAGRLGVQEGAKYLEKSFGGRGILLGGVPGIRKGKVVIIGAGISGTNAAKMAIGLGADVTVMDISARRLQEVDDIFGSHIKTLFSTRYNILEEIATADLVIGAVLIPGAAAPKLVRREDLKLMKPGAVIVDIAIDQGGCIETSRPTSHNNPTYVVDGIVHYCVANMPGAVSLSSTMALTSVTNKYGLMIANLGLEAALAKSKPLQAGLNCYDGKLTNMNVASALKMEYTPYPA